ncbi:MAG TPA: hypothetical protein VIM31_00470 [Candidatus Microsaccharimonas sp.]
MTRVTATLTSALIVAVTALLIAMGKKSLKSSGKSSDLSPFPAQSDLHSSLDRRADALAPFQLRWVRSDQAREAFPL